MVDRRFTNVLFDLDGTLVDPGEGISRTVQFVLDRLAPASRLDGALGWYVGPPLREIFSKLLPAYSSGELIERAVSLYLERYESHGARESVVYPGITEMLAGLSESHRLFVVTSKNTAIAEQILSAHGLRRHFEILVGTERDDRFESKGDAIRFLLRGSKLKSDSTAMVGDREHDVIAGRRNGVFTIGVTYGYGSRRELTEAGADRICDTPRALFELIAR